MKRRIRWTGLLAALMLLAGMLVIPAGAQEETSSSGNNYVQAQIFHAALMAIFPKDADGKRQFPDFVGGIYYNNEGNLVLQIVQEAAAKDAELYSSVEQFIAETPGIVVESAVYPHNELNAMTDTLIKIQLAGDRPEAFKNVVSFKVDTAGNGIVMSLANCSEEEIARFQSTVSDSPMIRFVQAPGRLVNHGTGNDYAFVKIGGRSVPWGVLIALCVAGPVLLALLFWPLADAVEKLKSKFSKKDKESEQQES